MSTPVILMKWMVGLYVYSFSFPFVFRKAAGGPGKILWPSQHWWLFGAMHQFGEINLRGEKCACLVLQGDGRKLDCRTPQRHELTWSYSQLPWFGIRTKNKNKQKLKKKKHLMELKEKRSHVSWPHWLYSHNTPLGSKGLGSQLQVWETTTYLFLMTNTWAFSLKICLWIGNCCHWAKLWEAVGTAAVALWGKWRVMMGLLQAFWKCHLGKNSPLE